MQNRFAGLVIYSNINSEIVEHRRRHPPDPIRIGGLALDASNPGSRLGHRLLRIRERQNRGGQF